MSRVYCLIAAVFVGSLHPIYCQTACAKSHSDTGTFICYPEADSKAIPDAFYLSAQVNAPSGRMIRAYAVLLDGKPIFRNKLALAENRLSIETNISSPLHSGTHTLTLMSDVGGRSDVSGVVFRPASEFGFCREFDRLEARSCVSQRNSTPLNWQLDRQKDFASNLSELSHNLGRLQEDTAEAAAVDENGNLVVASHMISGLEVRKYRSDGSILQDQLIRFCSQGFITIHGLAIKPQGQLWLTGETNACLPGSGNESGHDREMGAFLIALDTTLSGEKALLYLRKLPQEIKSVSALDLDRAGDIYMVGRPDSGGAQDGSVFKLDRNGSKLLFSYPLPGIRLETLALDDNGILYAGGWSHKGMAIIGIDSSTKRIVYRARMIQPHGDFGALAMAFGKAGGSSRLQLAGNGNSSFQMSLEPCRSGSVQFENLSSSSKDVPDVALRLAVDRMASSADTAKRTPPRGFTVEQAPACQGYRR